MSAYYNEIDPYAAQWLRNLIAAGHLPAGDVDERSICDVQPDDLVGYRQCHFFAGIGGWALACRLAGWADDREIWTGSPPCQPFSVAGKQRGHDDERHLWPELLRLIAARRPVVVFGEQVAIAAGATHEEGPSIERAFESLAREKPGAFESYCQGIQERKSRREHDCGRQEAREAEKLALRFGGFSRGTDNADQLCSMRVDGDATQSVWRPEGLGHAVTGSDSAGAWLYGRERASDRVRAERDDADVGSRARHVDHGCAESQGSGEEREPSGKVRGSIRAPTARDWLDGVQSDLHELGYTCGAAIVPCCAVNAPHRRDRLWFVGHAQREGLEGFSGYGDGRPGRSEPDRPVAASGSGGDVEHAQSIGRREGRAEPELRGWRPAAAGAGVSRCDVADSDSGRLKEQPQRDGQALKRGQPSPRGMDAVGSRARNGALAHADESRLREGREQRGGELGRTGGDPWARAGWIIGHDGKARRVEPGLRLLAHGIPARVGKLRAYGNAIVPQVAAEIIAGYLDVQPDYRAVE